MKVVLLFQRRSIESTDDQLVSTFYGEYNIGGFAFVCDTEITAFWTMRGQLYTSYTCSGNQKSLPAPWRDKEVDILLLSVDEQEQDKLLKTCTACVQSKKAFNLRDLLLLFVPFREVQDTSVFEAPTLNNPQAIILVLRECLNAENPLRSGLDGLHSRQTVLDTLYSSLRPYTLPVCWQALVNLVKWLPAVDDTAQIFDLQH
jgi:hypothetical protein